MGLLGTPEFVLSTTARQLGHALWFWGEITREVKKWIKLSLGHFLLIFICRYRAPSAPKPGRITQSPCSMR